jgi:transcriptional regulator with XRE-family HTH domain
MHNSSVNPVGKDAYAVLVRRLRAARKRTGLRQADVAAVLGRPQSFVSKIELGERRLDPIELKELANLYKVEVSALLEGLA